MIVASVWMAWVGSSLWVGATVLWTTVSVTRLETTNDILKVNDSFVQAMGGVRQRLNSTVITSTALTIIGVAAEVALTGHTAIPLGISSVLAAITLLWMMFHVEHRTNSDRRHDFSYGAIVVASMVAYVATSAEVITRTSFPMPTLMRWATTLPAGLLIGTALASAALIPLLRDLSSPEGEQTVAIIARRWTFHMGSLALVLVLAGIGIIRRLWSTNHLVIALGLSATLLLPLLFILITRVIINGQLEGILRELPILGFHERRLRARVMRTNDAARRVLRYGAYTAVLSAIIAATFIGLTSTPSIISSLPSTTVPTAASVLPTTIPTALPGDLILMKTDSGVSVTMRGSAPIVGTDVLHFFISNAQGALLEGASVTLVISPMLISSGSTTLPALADVGSKPPSFIAAVTFAQPGNWQIVVLIATADQSVTASVVFAVSVS